MSAWNYIVTFIKFRLIGFEAAADYVLGLLNDFLKRDDIASRVEEGYRKAKWVADWLDRLAKYCPGPWLRYYSAVYSVVRALVDMFADGKVETAELAGARAAFEKAYSEWTAD